MSKVKGQRSNVKGQRSKVKGQRSNIKCQRSNGEGRRAKGEVQSSKILSYNFFNMRAMTSQITLELCAETADLLFESIKNKWDRVGTGTSLIFGHNFLTMGVMKTKQTPFCYSHKSEQVLLFECITNRR